MTRDIVLLKRLRAQLGVWTATIQRSVGAQRVEIVSAQEPGEFTLRAEWADGDVHVSHSRTFSRQYVFGHTCGGNPLALAIQKRACDYARDFMREVLNMRGLKV